MDSQTDPIPWDHVVSEYDPNSPPSEPVSVEEDYSELYSVPRRFDLASMLVITAGYAMLFSCMKVLDFSVWAFIYFACMIAFVGIAQSIFHEQYNPRTISKCAGIIYQGFIVSLVIVVAIFPLRIFEDTRGLSYVDGYLLLMVFAFLVSPFLGYLSGTLVAGVFLIADVLRELFRLLHLNRSAELNQSTVKSPWDE